MLAATMLVGGCTPSIDSVIGMRESLGPSAARRNYVNLLRHLGDPVPGRRALRPVCSATWRIEALRTLHHIDRELDYWQTDSELNARLLAMTRREYELPGSSSDYDEVRAWAVHLLGSMRPRQPTEQFVKVVVANPPHRDGQYTVTMAALGVLHPRLDEVAADGLLRRRMLYRLAQISGELETADISAQRRKELTVARAAFQQELTSYAAIVDLLAEAGGRGDLQALLEVIRWNYQQLAAGSHTDGGAGDLFAQNRGLLLDLAWHRDAAVRSRSRLTLGEFAPDDLLVEMTRRVEGVSPSAPEDHRQLVTLVRRLDKTRPGDQGHHARRERALAAIFAAIPGIAQDQREIIYGQLVAHAPQELAAALLGDTSRAMGESQALCLQHVRYLEHLRGRLSDSPGQADRQINQAMAALMQHPSLAVKRQVAASIASRDPLLFARSCATGITRLASEPADTAEYLIDAYMASLARLESGGGLAELAAAMHPASPYELLASGVARPELRPAFKVAAFLEPRDCDLLVGMLCEDIEQRLARGGGIDSRRWCLLGDVVIARRSQLSDEPLAAATGVLLRGLELGDAEQAMLCARYLLEMGHDPAGLHSGIPDVAAMIALAAEAAANASQPPDAGGSQ